MPSLALKKENLQITVCIYYIILNLLHMCLYESKRDRNTIRETNLISQKFISQKAMPYVATRCSQKGCETVGIPTIIAIFSQF